MKTLFNLEEWYKNPLLKTVNRDGKEVKIISVMGVKEHPIVGVVEGLYLQEYDKDGKPDNDEMSNRLFFDKPDIQLTEFEKKVKEVIGHAMGGDYDINDAEDIRCVANHLLINADKTLHEDTFDRHATSFEKALAYSVEGWDFYSNIEDIWLWAKRVSKNLIKIAKKEKDDY